MHLLLSNTRIYHVQSFRPQPIINYGPQLEHTNSCRCCRKWKMVYAGGARCKPQLSPNTASTTAFPEQLGFEPTRPSSSRYTTYNHRVSPHTIIRHGPAPRTCATESTDAMAESGSMANDGMWYMGNLPCQRQARGCQESS